MKPEKILDAMELKLAEFKGLTDMLAKQSPVLEPDAFEVYFDGIGVEIKYARESLK